jgi:hypothetical protein
MTLGGIEPAISRLRAEVLAVSGQGQVKPDVGIEPPWRLTRALPSQQAASGKEPPPGLEPSSSTYETDASPAMLQGLDGLDRS